MDDIEKRKWAVGVIERSLGWRFAYAQIDDLMQRPKCIIIHRRPGFHLFFRLWPFYIHFSCYTRKMMMDHLMHPDGPKIWIKGKPEIRIGRP